MDDLDRVIAASLRAAADHAPSDGGLLATVQQKSRRYRRRRIATGLSTAAVLVIGIPLGTALVTGSGPAKPADTVQVAPAATAGSPSASGTPSAAGTPSPRASATRRPPSSTPSTSSGSSDPVVRLVHGYTAPTFPYTLPPTDGMRAPVASMQAGSRIAFFEATELRHHADITVTVSTRKPGFTAPATTKIVLVRGHSGTLRTVDTQPAKQLVLFWRESASRWIQLATDDTYTSQQVVDLAGSLSAASIAVLPPFTLDLTPADLTADTVTASTMSFRTANGGTVEVVLRKRQQLTSATDTVGEYQARLTHDGGSAKLSVDVTDWDATLELTVSAGLTISDADLLRFAAGVHILNRSDPK
jgi:hypothetical protein